jgi:ribosomal-protein-alanine N-acetyltransferase
VINDSTVTIRPATLADVPAILALQRQSPTSAQWSEAQYRDLISSKRPQRLMLAAESATGGLLGLLVAHDIGVEWELENIVVAPHSRRGGIGQSLLTALIERAKQSNSETVFLEVRESNVAARTLYEKCGFRPTGRRKSYYSNPLEDSILYRLNFPRLVSS